MAAYATQMDAAKQGILTPEMETVAKEEHLEPELIRQRVAKGTIAFRQISTTRACTPMASARDCGRK